MENLIRRPLTRRLAIYSIALAVLLSIGLSIYIHFNPSLWLDIAFSGEVQEHTHRLLTTIMQLVSWPGSPLVGIATVLATAAIFWLAKYRRAAMCFLLVLAADVLSYIIKFVVNRPRPTQEFVSVAGKQLAEPGFPSTHVVHYVVYFGFLAFVVMLIPKLASWLRYSIVAVCLLMIVSVSVSRIYLGAHWLTDVIAGYLFGGIFLAAIIAIYLHAGKKN